VNRNTHGLKVGDKLYAHVESSKPENSYGYWVVIRKVGRKWFTCQSDRSWKECRIDIDTLDVHPEDGRGRLYLSPEHRIETIAQQEIENAARKARWDAQIKFRNIATAWSYEFGRVATTEEIVREIARLEGFIEECQQRGDTKL